MIDILLSPFLLSVVLVGIHAYFGLKIIQRGIIFTDLAIGQMAALGTAISLLLLHGEYLYLVSLGCALVGGGLIAWASQKILQLEAFIGLLYAFGVSGVFILLSNSPHGMEEFQELMAADILFTPLEDVFKTAGIYILIGVFIYFIQQKISGVLQDILFFTTFAITVTSSVKVAGVLVVFALLISPALMSIHLNKGNLVINAWLIGITINLIGVVLSYHLDFPTGYTLVFLHAFLTISWLLIESLVKKKIKKS